jgi:D-alanyl-D-alanine carboxypeptidase
VSGGRTSHAKSVPYLDRTPCRRGMACPGSLVVRAFTDVGWSWGGYWTGVKDYQHFSASGR